MEVALSSAEFESRNARNFEKKAEDRVKAAKGRAKVAEKRALKADERASELEAVPWRSEHELASARSEYDRFVQAALPAALEDARR